MKNEVFYDNYDDTAILDGVRESMKFNGIDADNITDSDIYVKYTDWFCDEDEWYWRCMINYVDDYINTISKDKNCAILVRGFVDKWNGKSEGGKVYGYFKTFQELLEDLSNNYDYHKVYIENGDLTVDATHHDGTDHYVFRILTRAGYDVWNEWQGSEEDVHKKLWESSNYTTKINTRNYLRCYRKNNMQLVA